MQTALDAPPEALDPSEKEFVAKVGESGFFRTSIIGDYEGPGFSYTTGFWVNAGQPELIMFGLKHEIAHDVFWDVFRDAKSDRAIPLGKKTDRLFANLPAYAFPVAKRFYPDHLGWSRWFYRGDEFPCIQIVWPDREGVFPWESGFDPGFGGDQPDLTEHGWRASLVS